LADDQKRQFYFIYLLLFFFFNATVFDRHNSCLMFW